MTKSRLLVGTISVIAFLATAVPPGHAGGGMGGSGAVTACRIVVGGTNPPQVVGLDLQSLPAEHVVQLGPPLLICEPADARTVNIPKAPETVFVATTNSTVCYPVHGPSSVKNAAMLEDPFTASTANPVQPITLTGISLLCVQGNVTP